MQSADSNKKQFFLNYNKICGKFLRSTSLYYGKRDAARESFYLCLWLQRTEI